MSTGKNTVFETGIVLALLLVPVAGFAQQTSGEDDELMPAVDTSAVDTSPDADEGRQADIDALEPGVDTPVLAQDITRRSSGSEVMDSIELGRTEITGNQELPKVLYIVPWQQADPGDLMGKPVNTLIDEVLAPIDREEFIRQVDYYGDLYGEEEQD